MGAWMKGFRVGLEGFTVAEHQETIKIASFGDKWTLFDAFQSFCTCFHARQSRFVGRHANLG
jgi:hypothetical protein